MTYRRLLTSLASHTSSASAQSSRLIPPYSFVAHPNDYRITTSNTPSSPSLRPPYAHQLPLPAPETRGRSLRSSQRYTIVPEVQSIDHRSTATPSQSWISWATDLLASDHGRQRVTEAWQRSVQGLANVKGRDVPEVQFHSLSSYLSENVEAIRQTGVVVARNVVQDSEAIEWARAVLRAMNERNGKPVFWHKALLEARSNPSVLSANRQVMRALTGVDGVYVHADSVYEGLGESLGGTFHLDEVWKALDTPAYTPLLSHLTLSPTLPSSPTHLTPTTHASIYSLLRPLFRPVRSRISFYTLTDYLSPSNWTLLDPFDLARAQGRMIDLPHLSGTEVALPTLSPGDMIFRHSAIPIHSTAGSGQVFLPLSPVPKSANNETWIKSQRDRFEQGLPPPGAKLQVNGVDDGMVLIEDKGDRADVGGRAGREAMGYD